MMTRFCVPIVSGNDRFEQDLLAILDRRRAALRADEPSTQALIARLLYGTASSISFCRSCRSGRIAQPDSQVSVFAFEPIRRVPQSGGDDVVPASAFGCDRTVAQWIAPAGKPIMIVVVARPDTRPDRERVSAVVVHALDYAYGAQPMLGWSGNRVPISNGCRRFDMLDWP